MSAHDPCLDIVHDKAHGEWVQYQEDEACHIRSKVDGNNGRGCEAFVKIVQSSSPVWLKIGKWTACAMLLVISYIIFPGM